MRICLTSENYKKILNLEVGWRVKQDGMYVCVPCGYRRRFNEGDIFPSCFACLKNKKYDDDIYKRFRFMGI